MTKNKKFILSLLMLSFLFFPYISAKADIIIPEVKQANLFVRIFIFILFLIFNAGVEVFIFNIFLRLWNVIYKRKILISVTIINIISYSLINIFLYSSRFFNFFLYGGGGGSYYPYIISSFWNRISEIWFIIFFLEIIVILLESIIIYLFNKKSLNFFKILFITTVANIVSFVLGTFLISLIDFSRFTDLFYNFIY